MSDILICDALIQYQRGRWASTPQFRIPRHVVEAAVAAFDPTQPLRFGHRKRTGIRSYVHRRIVGQKPACVHCKATKVRSCGWNQGRTERRWQCLACNRWFSANVRQTEAHEAASV